MPETLPPHYVQLVCTATLKSFWRRQTLHDFCRRCGVPSTFLTTWTEEESKRDFLNRLFPSLESTERGHLVLNRMTDALLDQRQFVDLDGWEESHRMKAEAQTAVAALRSYVARSREQATDEREQALTRKRAQEYREHQVQQQQDLGRLKSRLDAMASRLGEQGAGYEFQDWFFDLVEYFEIQNRRPYVTAGRQIDGSATYGDTTYLVELKFTKQQADATDVDSFRRKVESKADNTMGVMVSMSGYSSVAKNEASGTRTPLLLFDYQHLYGLLCGTLKLGELITRTRRHSSQTAEAYLDFADF